MLSFGRIYSFSFSIAKNKIGWSYLCDGLDDLVGKGKLVTRQQCHEAKGAI